MMANYGLNKFLKGSLRLGNIFDVMKYNREFRAANPDYFDPEGLLVFCGPQGSGKTLSAVQYIQKICWKYPKAILVTNTEITGLPEETEVIEYDGLDCLKKIENGYNGVIYFIDEIHLEFNSLESKNIPVEVFVEIAQQRKQRKHIIGTSQVYGRLAKPFREQLKWVVCCEKMFGVLQKNTLINAETSYEKDGQLITDRGKVIWWLHNPLLYKSYDTYSKMKRYRLEWQGRKIS